MRSRRQVLKRFDAANQGVPWIFALHMCRESEPVYRLSRQVLQTMQGGIDPILEQSVLDLADERAQDFAVALVPTRRNRDDLDREPVMQPLKGRLYLYCLGQCEFAAARAQAQLSWRGTH